MTVDLGKLDAGAALATRAAFGMGDEIGIDDTVGEVNDITSRTTVIRMRDGRHVHIPNVEMLKRTVTVYTAADERRSAVEVIVGFETDLDHVRCVLRTSLDGVEDIRRVGSIRSTVVASGIELSIRFWHSSSVESGTTPRTRRFPQSSLRGRTRGCASRRRPKSP